MSEIKKIVVNGIDGQREYGLEDSVVRQDVQEIVAGAPEELDSFREAFEAFKEGGEALATITESVERNAKAIADETERAQGAERVLDRAITEEVRRATTAEQGIKAKALDASSAEYETTENTVVLKFATIEGVGDEITIPAATAEKAGVMSAEDKKALNAVPSKIESAITKESKATDEKIADEKTRAEAAEQALADDIANAPNLALRALFVAAGAEYNGSGADKTKTAPWGETVTHKAGHYYLNGLGDITEGQMMDIYNAPHDALCEQGYIQQKKIRTAIFRGCSSSLGITTNIDAIFMGCNNIEVIGDRNFFLYFKGSSNAVRSLFRDCYKLRVINLKTFYVSGITLDQNCFANCQSLEYVNIERLHFSLSLADCSRISKNSIVHMIQQATPKSAITITLHHDAYVRLTAEQEVLDALTAKNEALTAEGKGGKISLVCATHSEEITPNA